MNNIIYVPFAYQADKNTGVNINKKNSLSIYLKNACVALFSAKKYNPDCTVALVTNLEIKEIPDEIVNLLKINKIDILFVPYDSFVFDKDYLWSLAFYKLCALQHVSQMNFDNICYMDTDVYVQSSIDYIWKECSQNILLYDINHGFGAEDYNILCNEVESYYGKEVFITHYGGEFFAASKVNSNFFINNLVKVYDKMIEKGVITSKGDEFLISISAFELKNYIKNAGAYIFRFWTNYAFRLISSCYKYNNICLLHVPNEKSSGMLKLYKKYISKNKLPKEKQVWKELHLTKIAFSGKLKSTIKNILKV